MEKDISVFRDYAISSLVTFATAFFLSLGAQLSAGIDPANILTTSFFLSLVSAAARAGVKAVIEAMAGMGGSYTIRQ